MAQLIKKTRKLRAMTQEDLAKQLHWSAKNAQYVSNVENGKCRFPPDHVGKLSIALTLPVDVIIEAMIKDFAYSLTEDVFGYEKPYIVTREFP